MKEKPILFSGPMVTAILEGRKTQTRRVTTTPESWVKFYDGEKAEATKAFHCDASIWNAGNLRGDGTVGRSHWQDGDERLPQNYQAGDMLWVRETWRATCTENGAECIEYRAGGDALLELSNDSGSVSSLGPPCIATPKGPKWRPSIFMPRWASRLTLEVVNVRVERVQEILEEDAKAEGTPSDGLVHYYCDEGDPNDPNDFGTHRCNWRYAFSRLWDSLNAKRGFSWESNPWVWVVEFKPLSAGLRP